MKLHIQYGYALIAIVLMILLAWGTIEISHEIFTSPGYSPDLESRPPMDGSNQAGGQDHDVTEDNIAHGNFNITFVGNCSVGSMLGSDIYGTLNGILAEDPELTTDCADLLKSDDFTVSSCNSVLSDNKLDAILKENDDSKWLLGFASNADFYKANGIDHVSVETTHIGDYGDEGISDTKASLETAEIGVISFYSSLTFEKDGYTVTVLTMRFDEYNTNCVYAVQHAAATSDIVIVYGEADDEGETPSEWRQEGAKAMIDAGATAVIQYTSLLQPMEYYGDGIIAYSIGNFIDGGTAPDTVNACVLFNLKIDITQTVKLTPTLTPVMTDPDNWFPTLIHDPAEADSILSAIMPK